jgi:SAM-dependent methyltransferase
MLPGEIILATKLIKPKPKTISLMENLINYRARKVFSGKYAKQYPLNVPPGETHQVYRDNIRSTCLQSPFKIAVLELGCGSGRYFRFLSNVEKVVGIDISEDMLEIARENLKSIPGLEPVTSLVQSDIESFRSDEKFDFIYSIGTLGEYCAFDEKILGQILTYLKPGGFFFFTLVDSESFVPKEYVWPRKRLWRFFLRLLPAKIRQRIDADSLVVADWRNLFLNTKDVENIFSKIQIPVRWELSKAKDSQHIHHICKLWLLNE